MPEPSNVQAIGGVKVRVGTASWTDPTLLREEWYPAGVSTAESRLRYYSRQFPIVEADAPFYAIPSPTVAQQWVNRTDASFRFNVKAFAPLTGHRVVTSRLPASVREGLPPKTRDLPMVGPSDLSTDDLVGIRKCFNDAIAPLTAHGRLGAVLFQYSSAFRPEASSYATIEQLRIDFPVLPVAIEFRHRDWTVPHTWARVLDQLRRLQITFVAVDAPAGLALAMPPVDSVTTPGLAVLRLHGRNSAAWASNHASAATRFQYRYSERELEGDILPRIRRLAGEADEIHVLFNNCFGSDGVRNATTIRRMIDAVGAAR